MDDILLKENYDNGELFTADDINTTNKQINKLTTDINNINIDGKADITYVDSQIDLVNTKLDDKQNINDNNLLTTAQTIVGAINEVGGNTNTNTNSISTLTENVNNLELTKADINYVDSSTFNKQDKLISGTNIKTINGLSVIGGGNIQIQGGSGGVNSVTGGDGFVVEDTTGKGDYQIDLNLKTINGNDIRVTDDTTNIVTATANDITNLQKSINTKLTAPNGVQKLDMDSFDVTSSIFVQALTRRGTNDYITFDQVVAKQDKTDNNLTTTDKTIVGAINYLQNQINIINNLLGVYGTAINENNRLININISDIEELKQKQDFTVAYPLVLTDIE